MASPGRRPKKAIQKELRDYSSSGSFCGSLWSLELNSCRRRGQTVQETLTRSKTRAVRIRLGNFPLNLCPLHLRVTHLYLDPPLHPVRLSCSPAKLCFRVPAEKKGGRGVHIPRGGPELPVLHCSRDEALETETNSDNARYRSRAAET